MFIFYNNSRYKSEKYGDETVIDDVQADWIDFSFNSPFIRYYYIQEQIVQS